MRNVTVVILAVAIAMSACSGRERRRLADISSFTRDCSQELALRVAGDFPGGGAVLLLLPPDDAGEKALNRARVAGARAGLPSGRFTLVEHRVDPALYAFDMQMAAFAVRDFTVQRFSGWAGEHGPVVAVISCVGLPPDATPQGLAGAPVVYWMNYGKADPSAIQLIRAKRLRALLTYRGANGPAEGIAKVAPAVMQPDTFELLVPAP